MCVIFFVIFFCVYWTFLGEKSYRFSQKKKKKVFNSFSPNLLMYATVNYEPKLLGPYN